MSYELQFSREAVRDIDAVPPALKGPVGQALTTLAADPLLAASGASATAGLRHLQVDDCRVVYGVDEANRAITVWRIERLARDGDFAPTAPVEGFEFVLQGRPRRASRRRVIEAMRDLAPDPDTPWMVEIEDTDYPVLQAFIETFGAERGNLSSERAARLFERLGFAVSKRNVRATRRRPKVATALARTVPLYRPERFNRKQYLLTQPMEFPLVVLRWSYQWGWDELANAADDSPDIDLPPEAPGVYDVRGRGRYESLYIGQTQDLLRRVYYGLVKGILPHTAGDKIRENENPPDLSVRWAYTDRPAAVEEELIRLHIETFGHPPTYAARR